MLAWPFHHAENKIQNNWKLLITLKKKEITLTKNVSMAFPPC